MCSFDDNDGADLWRETLRKARRDHQCSCCETTIRPGERYVYITIIHDGSVATEKVCAPCNKIRDEFEREHDQVPAPSYLVEGLRRCVSEEPESGAQWLTALNEIAGMRAHG